MWSGTELSWIPSPNGNVIVLSPNQALVVTILLVVVTINAVNFIDGLDGLAAGIVGISALAFFAYSYTLVRVAGASTQSLPALVSAILAGMCLGFLPHNFYPARIFMGDTGAMLLGLLLAYGPISSTATLDPSILKNTLNRFPTILPILLPAAIFIIPYADLLLAVARRARAGQSPFAPDKKHLHHRLLNIGHSHRKSVLIMYLWAALFAVTVVSLSVVRTKLLILAGVTLAGMLILLLVSVPRLRPHRRVRPAVGSAAGPLVVNAAGTTAAGPAVPAGLPVRRARRRFPAGLLLPMPAVRPVPMPPAPWAPMRPPGSVPMPRALVPPLRAPGGRPAGPGSRPAAPGGRPPRPAAAPPPPAAAPPSPGGHPGTGSPP